MQVAVAYALPHLGEPYLWGGDGPDAGDAGFDCSGLTTAAYTATGIHLPRTADTQYHAGPAVPPGTAIAAGDVVFFGDPHIKITHVAIYLGDGQIVQAPRREQPVQITELATMSRYAGATCPPHWCLGLGPCRLLARLFIAPGAEHSDLSVPPIVS